MFNGDNHFGRIVSLYLVILRLYVAVSAAPIILQQKSRLEKAKVCCQIVHTSFPRANILMKEVNVVNRKYNCEIRKTLAADLYLSSSNGLLARDRCQRAFI